MSQPTILKLKVSKTGHASITIRNFFLFLDGEGQTNLWWEGKWGIFDHPASLRPSLLSLYYKMSGDDLAENAEIYQGD